MKKVVVNVKLGEETYNKLKDESNQTGNPMSSIIRFALLRHLNSDKDSISNSS